MQAIINQELVNNNVKFMPQNFSDFDKSLAGIQEIKTVTIHDLQTQFMIEANINSYVTPQSNTI